jgi:hypothetical protein
MRALPTTASRSMMMVTAAIALSMGSAAGTSTGLVSEHLAGLGLALTVIYLGLPIVLPAACAAAAARRLHGIKAITVLSIWSSVTFWFGYAIAWEAAGFDPLSWKTSGMDIFLMLLLEMALCTVLVLTCTAGWYVVRMYAAPSTAQDGSLCSFCAYHIAGLRSPRCPECGAEIHASERALASGARMRLVMTISVLLAIAGPFAYAASRYYLVLLPRYIEARQFGEPIIYLGSMVTLGTPVQLSSAPAVAWIPLNTTSDVGLLLLRTNQGKKQSWQLQLATKTDGGAISPTVPVTYCSLKVSQVEAVQRNGLPPALLAAFASAYSSGNSRPAEQFRGVTEMVYENMIEIDASMFFE